MKSTTRLRELINRKDKCLAVMIAPTAAHARVMQEAGLEAGFVGTNSVVCRTYTGLGTPGVVSLTEILMIAGWIARSVTIPVMMDGDTGHGGIMAVRRMIRECINAGIAGIRIEDLPLEGKRGAQNEGLEVVPLKQAIARFRAAVDMKNELDPDFVIMAQCYGRDAVNSSFDDCIARMKAYKEEAGVDWVQLVSPHSIDEIKRVRAAVAGPFSFMKGELPRNLSLKEHLELGVNIAWYSPLSQHVTWAALWDFMQAFNQKDIGAWEDFQASRKDRPYPRPYVGPQGEGSDLQRKLANRYFSASGSGGDRK
jgi:2-methylisocitrate lyase-like PEP mutase family enzyme